MSQSESSPTFSVDSDCVILTINFQAGSGLGGDFAEWMAELEIYFQLLNDSTIWLVDENHLKQIEVWLAEHGFKKVD